jgi:integrase
MAHRKVSIYLYGKTPEGGWKYLRPALATNNKIRPGFGLLHGTPTKLDSYKYVLNVGGKWIPAGDTPKEAQQAAELKQAELTYVAVGGEVQEEKPETAQTPKTKITDSIEAYMANLSADVSARNKRPRTYTSAKQILNEFAACEWRKSKSPLRHLEEIAANDVKQYVGWVIDNSKTKSRRTGENKFIRVKSWLTWAGHKVVTSKDAPVVPQKSSVHILSEEVLAKFFAACTDPQRLIYTTFLQTGMRDGELVYLEKTDLHWNDGKPYIDIIEKPKYGWIPKWYQLRKIFIPVDLYEALDKHRKRSCVVDSPWMFATSFGQQKWKLLQTAQRIAKRAGLDPKEVTLHDFRRTYATTCLRKGMDIPTVKKQLGHSPKSNAIWKYVEALAESERSRKVTEVWSVAPKPLVEQETTGTIQ